MRGLGTCSVLFIVFLVLKLTDNVDWSWWWVTAPIWIPWSVIIVLALTGISILKASDATGRWWQGKQNKKWERIAEEDS